MQKWLSVGLSASLALLVGCDTQIQVKTNLTDLQQAQDQVVTAALSVDIPECDKPAAKPKKGKKAADAGESNETGVKDQVLNTYKGAKYLGCADDGSGLTAKAKFSAPVRITQGNPKNSSGDSILVLTLNQKTLHLVIPEALQASLKGEDGEASHKYSFVLDLDNNTANRTLLKIPAGYVDDAPTVDENVCLQTSGQMSLRLSEVSFARALAKGSVPVFQIVQTGTCE